MRNPTLRLATLTFIIAGVSAVAAGTAPSWQIDPKGSEIGFTAIQNNAPIKGGFKTFTGDIKFDPSQLDTSKIKIAINIGSLNAPTPDMINTLLSPDWFDAKKFPQAVFKSDHFVKTGENTFQAQGNLTIRDKTVPTTLSFTLKEYSPEKAQVVGTTSIKRTAFGVGQGEWSSPDVVKDEIQIDFKITALPAK